MDKYDLELLLKMIERACKDFENKEADYPDLGELFFEHLLEPIEFFLYQLLHQYDKGVIR